MYVYIYIYIYVYVCMYLYNLNSLPFIMKLSRSKLSSDSIVLMTHLRSQLRSPVP